MSLTLKGEVKKQKFSSTVNIYIYIFKLVLFCLVNMLHLGNMIIDLVLQHGNTCVPYEVENHTATVKFYMWRNFTD